MGQSRLTSHVAFPRLLNAAAKDGTACPMAFVDSMEPQPIHKARAPTQTTKVAWHSAMKVCRLLIIRSAPFVAYSPLDLQKFVLTDQFEGYTEVSRCDDNGNSWCCAGAAGQMFPPVDCCPGNLTTSLQPFPFTTFDLSGSSETEPKSKTVFISRTVLISFSLPGAPKFTFPKNPVSLPLATTSQLTSQSSTIAYSSPVSSQSPVIVSSSPGSSRASATVSSSSVSSQTSTIVPSSPVPPKPLSPTHSSRIGIEIGVPLAVITIILVSLAFYIFQKKKSLKQDLVELEGRAAWELDHCHTDACHPIVPRYELG